MDRRHKGEGMVRQRGRKWYGIWRADGERHEKPLGYHADMSETQAYAAMRKLMREQEGEHKGESVTIEVAGQAFRERLELRKRSKSHREGVESHLRVHIVPFDRFSKRGQTMATITRRDVDAFVIHLDRLGRAPKTIRNIVSTLHSVFEHARREGWATVNPVEFAETPEIPVYDTVQFLTIAELRTVLDRGLAPVVIDPDAPTTGRTHTQRAQEALWRPMERALYLTAATTGLRMGELRALRWGDIDWSGMRLRVEQNVVMGETKRPKGKKVRPVPVAAQALAELDRWSQTTAFRADGDLVFANPSTGQPIDRSKVLKRWKAACARAGVRVCPFHELRHTFGTLAASAGAAPAELQAWAGWEDSQTAKRYLHYAPARDESAFLSDVFGGLE